ncbi:MAG: NAD-binding protein [Methanobrevibacter ruminantium]|uniref:NAD-binding protein n=1 Tax=Methanobrevibacter ruminantium TaxID=83816 RepID=UPI0026EA1D23|nr:NAD-binding protein [Methanobrevibacter ruminantium]MCI5737653.1 NAD-binding protein [Methanobrevibacter ruminantium]MDD6048656.1 NAD-binding protein [Methanobrevibacter ruminantium]
MKGIKITYNYSTKDRTGIYAVLIIFIILIYGILGSIYIMGLDIYDSIYYTIITLATVGYGDIIPITPLQKIFSVTLALSGVGVLAYIVTFIINSVTQNLQDMRSGRIMERKLSDMKNHYILCGFGRVGAAVCEELMKRNQKVIIIEKNEKRLEDLEENENVILLNANATEDKTLKKVNIDKSLGVIVATGSDVDNLFIVLTTRELYNDAWIVSRASKKESIKRLKHAGANKVISPEASGGTDIYFASVQPNLVHITEKHGVEIIGKELEILRKYNCHLENIEYHFHGIKTPVSRTIGVLDKSEEDAFIERINSDKNVRESLETIYSTVNEVHSHLVSGPDQFFLNMAIKELENEGIVLGVNLSFDEINEFTKQFKE